MTSQDYSRLLADLPVPRDDADLAFARALGLPPFEVEDMSLTLVERDGVIEKVFYPVFSPDESAGEVADWLENQAHESKRSPQ